MGYSNAAAARAKVQAPISAQFSPDPSRQAACPRQADVMSLREAINQVLGCGGDKSMWDEGAVALIRGAFWDGCIPDRALKALRVKGFEFTYEVADQWAAPVLEETVVEVAKKRRRIMNSVTRVLDFSDC